MEDGTTDELMQFKAQVIRLTQQLVEQEARACLLVEEKTRLEEQMRLASGLQARVKQHIFERKAREKILVEQNARLEERARLSRDLHDSVKQHVFALAVQIELARSRLDQDRRAVLEHLNEADELRYATISPPGVVKHTPRLISPTWLATVRETMSSSVWSGPHSRSR